MDGEAVGKGLGSLVGKVLGEVDGETVEAVGNQVGLIVGDQVGKLVGVLMVGEAVGKGLGSLVGKVLGEVDGETVEAIGEPVGEVVGAVQVFFSFTCFAIFFIPFTTFFRGTFSINFKFLATFVKKIFVEGIIQSSACTMLDVANADIATATMLEENFIIYRS